VMYRKGGKIRPLDLSGIVLKVVIKIINRRGYTSIDIKIITLLNK